jgi:membrane protein YdbS with pleckstrin-like domain
MSKPTEHQVAWIYEGIWGLLSGAFCVPRAAPELPTQGTELISARKPSLNYLGYLKFQLRLGMAFAAIPLVVGSLVLAAVESGWFLVGTVAIVLGLCFIGLISVLAIHLSYDTMWYVFSDRSMRLRRGIWVIRESTITFENIQNVKVMQGPLQRWYGIADVVVETAGGGGSHAEHGGGFGMHSGVIEGVADATAIRDAIMNRVRMANTAGLGDESHDSLSPHGGWSASHIAMLREIRDLANQATAS